MTRLIKEFKLKYKPAKRIFEDTGYVDPEISYHVHIENVVNSHNQDLKTMVDHGRYFSMFAPRQIKSETTDAIVFDDVNKAIQLLLKEKNAHFDNLKEKVLLYKVTFNRLNTQKLFFFIG